MKQVYFIRHGESEANIARKWGGHADYPLTATGHQQAKKAARLAKKQGLSFDVIISSPLSRAHHTAQHLAKELNYPLDQIVIEHLFIERSYGVLDGQDFGEAHKKYTVDEKGLDEYEGVETFLELHDRAQQAWQYIQDLPHERILIVSHGNFGQFLRRVIKEDPLHIRGERIYNAEILRFL